MTAAHQFELGPARVRGGLTLYLGQRRRDGMPVVVASGPGAGSLSGPSFPPVLARGEDWVAFARPLGHDLAVRLAGGPLILEEALRLGLAVGRVLAALHDREPPVMLVDLGPGAVIQGTGGQFYLDLMAPPLPAGSPYLPPELDRDKSQATPASDMYSLGALLYHALYGQPPGRPPVVIPRDDRVPPLLTALLARCLSLDPDHRPQATTMVQDLRSLLYARAAAEEETVETDDPWTRLGIPPAVTGVPGAPGVSGASGAPPGFPPGFPPAAQPPATARLLHRGGRSVYGAAGARRGSGAPPVRVWLGVILAGALVGVGTAALLGSRPLLGSNPGVSQPASARAAPATQLGGAPGTVSPTPGAAQPAGPLPDTPPADHGVPADTAAAAPGPAPAINQVAAGTQADLPPIEYPPSDTVTPAAGTASAPVAETPPAQPAPETSGTGNIGNTGNAGNTGNTGGTGNTDDTGDTGSAEDTGSTDGAGDTGDTGGAGDTGDTAGAGNTGNTGSADGPPAAGSAETEAPAAGPVTVQGTPGRIVVNGFTLGETIVFWSGNRLYLSAAEFQRLFGITVHDQGNQVLLVAGNQSLKAESFQRTAGNGLWLQVDSRSLQLAGYTYLGAVESGGLTHVYLRPLAP